ncbi:MAG: multidrug efflux MFS transporter [Bacillus sp. (in: Bacteria)]|nr:multidrug efflux MFS transporter [Bacillus sp. (in: firmicutes)]
METTTKQTERAPYGIIAVLMIGAFIAFLNNTLLNVALPSIMDDFNVGAATVQWLTTGFMLVNGILIPTSAFFIQKYSVRRLFLTAMGLFTIGTIIAGFAPVFGILLTGRMVQASATAIMMPLLMTVILRSFPVERRGSVMGILGFIMMAAPATGPTLSGWIIQTYDWRMLFFFVAPISIAVVLIGFFLLNDKKEKVNIRLDVKSVILSSFGFGGLLFGFSSAGERGWTDPFVYVTIAVGIVSLVSFILRQLKMDVPMLNFKVYRYPMYSLASAIAMTMNMALFSGMLLLPIYVQTIRGYSPMEAGLMLLPGALTMAFMSPITGKLFDKFGGRLLAISGLTIMTVTTYMFSQLSMETPYSFLVILHAVRMFGMSMVMMPVSTNGLNQLPPSFYPHGTAMNNTLNQVSAAIGTAVLVTIMSIRTDIYAQRMIADAGGAEGLTESAMTQIQATAMLGGINDSFLVSAYMIIIALVLAFFIKRAKQSEEPEDVSGPGSGTRNLVTSNVESSKEIPKAAGD